jgi:hypothetical protein
MTVTIGHLTFDNATYDERGRHPLPACRRAPGCRRQRGDPRGHVLRFDATGKIIGLTIINAKWLLGRDGEITVTLPEQVHVEPAALEEALAAA